MDYQAELKELPECIVYSTTMVLPDYEAYFDLIPPLGEKVIAKYPDLKCSSPEYCFVKYLDGQYKDQDINIEFCEAVDQMKPDFEDIVFKKIEAVDAVCVRHQGPYTNISKAYAYLMQWIEDNGYLITDYPREKYIDGIWNKENESEWLTELQIPVVKKS